MIGMDDYIPIDRECRKCGDSLFWFDCYNCNQGYSHHDCGEDSCNCGYPEDNVRCDVCNGEEGWTRCLNDKCGTEPKDPDLLDSGEGK